MPSASIPAIAAVAIGGAAAATILPKLIGGGSPKMPELSNPGNDLAASQAAANAATNEQQRLASARAGAGSSLLQNSTPSSLLASTRKTLGTG